MRDEWHTALREPYAVDDGLARERPTGWIATANVMVMIVAAAAAVIAIMAISVATCSASPGGGRLVFASMAVWAVALTGTCVIAHHRRTWLNGATVATACAAFLVVLGAFDHASAQERFFESASRGAACGQVEPSGD